MMHWLLVVSLLLGDPGQGSPGALLQEPARKGQSESSKEAASAVLAQAEALLYKPDVGDLNALNTLTFKVDRELAPGKPLWTMTVEWRKGGEAAVSGSVAKDAPLPQATRAQLEMSLPTLGQVLASEQLGRPYSFWSKLATPSIDGTEDGLLRIRLVPTTGSKAEFAEKVLLVDDKHVLQRARTVLPNGNTLKEAYQWRGIDDKDTRLVPTSVTAELAFQGMAITRTTEYLYRRIEGIHLVVKQSIKTTGIPNSPVRSEDLHFTGFIVNGKPADVR